MTEAYRALALQTTCHAINNCPDEATARAKIAVNIDRAEGFCGPIEGFGSNAPRGRDPYRCRCKGLISQLSSGLAPAPCDLGLMT